MEVEIGDRSLEDGIHDDKAILDRSGHEAVDAWSWVDIVGMGQVVADDGKVKPGAEVAEEQEPQMADVIEPRATENDVQESRHSYFRADERCYINHRLLYVIKYVE